MTSITDASRTSSNSLVSDQLQARIQGRVIAPGDPQYDEMRAAWNLTIDQHPALIVAVKSAADMAEVVRFARSADLKVAVQATGHGVIQPANDSVLINTSEFTEVSVNAEARTAWVSAGAKWGKVLEQTQAVGLAPLLGSSPGVGAVGYTLGGGLGWLARKYGLSIDSVNCFDVVLADGRIVEASETQNSDLFWGLRGGGGGLGVVTGMEVRLYPVTSIYGGTLAYPIELAREVFSRYREWIAAASDELTSSIGVVNVPLAPFFPEPIRGKTIVLVRGGYCGSLEQGEALLKFWRDWQTPLVDDFKALPFGQVAQISKDPLEPSAGMNSSAWLDDLSDEVVTTLLKYVVAQSKPWPVMAMEIRHTGGAIARVDPRANAFGHRDAPYVLQVLSPGMTPEARTAFRQHAAPLKQALQSHVLGVYLNFMSGEEARAHTRAAFSTDSYRRLQAIKAKYDPDNFFSHSYDLAATDSTYNN